MTLLGNQAKYSHEATCEQDIEILYLVELYHVLHEGSDKYEEY